MTDSPTLPKSVCLYTYANINIFGQPKRKYPNGMCFRLSEIEGIFVFGDPKVCVVGIGSNDFNIYHLSDALTTLGWHLSVLQYPAGYVTNVAIFSPRGGGGGGTSPKPLVTGFSA